jgi:hypothetical protein
LRSHSTVRPLAWILGFDATIGGRRSSCGHAGRARARVGRRRFSSEGSFGHRIFFQASTRFQPPLNNSGFSLKGGHAQVDRHSGMWATVFSEFRIDAFSDTRVFLGPAGGHDNSGAAGAIGLSIRVSQLFEGLLVLKFGDPSTLICSISLHNIANHYSAICSEPSQEPFLALLSPWTCDRYRFRGKTRHSGAVRDPTVLWAALPCF